MRILGLDLGEKNIGMAVSDELGLTAQGLDNINRGKDIEEDLDRIKAIVQKYNVEKIVIGLPRNMDGSCGPQAQKALQFAKLVADRLKLPVENWDERLSTVSAQRLLIEADVSRKKRRRVVDKMAAVIILQSYLDARTKK